MNTTADALAAWGFAEYADLPWMDGVYVEASVTYWWRGPLGTYRAKFPQSWDDKRVGKKESRTIRGTLLGAHPDLGTVEFSSDWDVPRTNASVTIDLADVFFDAPADA